MTKTTESETTMETTDVELLCSIARGSSLSERMTCPAFEVRSTGSDESARRAADWEDAAGGGDRDRAMAARRAIGLDPNLDWRTFGDLSVSDPAKLPPWAKVLIDAVTGPEAHTAHEGVFGPFATDARLWLDRQAAGLPLGIEHSAREAFVDGLLTRLWRACAASLDLEAFTAAELGRVLGGAPAATNRSVAALDGSRQAWRERVTRLPGLARVVGVVYHHWREATSELLARLSADLPLLQDQILRERSPGPLTGVEMDAGDVHAGGRAVTLLAFSGGGRIVYKPKDLRVAGAFMEVVSFLNERGLIPNLPVRRLLGRGEYTWEETVGAAPCDDRAEVSSFYVRLGMLARLFQLLGARDMWLDNLIACGEMPMFVDLETLLQPRLDRIPAAGSQSSAMRAAVDRIAESVASLDMLSMSTPIAPGAPAEELGVLAPPGPFRTPFRYEMHVPPAERRMVSPDGFIYWVHTQHTPTLQGQPVDPTEFFDRIVGGYRSMQSRLEGCKESLRHAEGPLYRLRSAPVRIIVRSTWTYLKLVERSLAPWLLADPLRRECYLAHLFTSPPMGSTNANSSQLVACEIEDLRNLDVPYFTAGATTTAVRHAGGAIVPDVTEVAAWRRLMERVDALPDFPMAGEEAILWSTLSTTALGRRGRASPRLEVGAARASSSAESLLEQATAVGDVLLSAATDGGDGTLAWLGMVEHPVFGTLQLQPAGPDLLSGSAGLALVFGELFAATNEARWERAAEQAAEPVQSMLREGPDQLHRLLARSAGDNVPLACGLAGIGGAIYTLRVLARCLGKGHFLEQVESCVLALPIEELSQRAPLDVTVGTSGLLLALLAGSDGRVAGPSRSEREAAEVLAESLFARVVKDREIVQAAVTSPGLRARLPETPAALALAASRLIAVRGETSETEAELVAGLLKRSERELERIRRRRERLGLLLCGFSVPRDGHQETKRRTEALGEALIAREHPPPEASTRVLLDEIELFLLASGGGDSAACERAHGLVDMIVARHERTGRWIPEQFGAEQHCLSILDGLPALVRAFIRVANWGTWTRGSVRTLD